MNARAYNDYKTEFRAFWLAGRQANSGSGSSSVAAGRDSFCSKDAPAMNTQSVQASKGLGNGPITVTVPTNFRNQRQENIFWGLSKSYGVDHSYAQFPAYKAMVDRFDQPYTGGRQLDSPIALPRRICPTGSTDGVQFRTTKKVKGTLKSHVSHVVLDSTWENEVAHQFEVAGVVEAYVKNDRIDFSILYEWEGAIHRYFPDYLVRLRSDTPRARPFTLIWEVKGVKTTQDRVKFEAASRWCRAMNHHGGYGRWMFVFTDSMGQVKSTLRDVLEKLAGG